MNQSDEGKPTEAAQQDEQCYERILTVARHVLLSEDQVKRFLGCLLMIGLELTEVDPEAAPSTPASAHLTTGYWKHLPTQPMGDWHGSCSCGCIWVTNERVDGCPKEGR